jgi:hypothetical protein
MMSSSDERHDSQIVLRTSAERRNRIDDMARKEGKTRARFVRELLNEGYMRRYEPPTYVLDTGDWQPIETAPKDGQPLILAPHMMIGWWEFGDDKWMFLSIPLNEDSTIQHDWSKPIKLWYCLYADVAGVEPTHWLPCPMPPASADTHPKDGDSTEIEAPLVSGAVPKADARD